ncbi:hypothetical protein L1987_77189 [Smallanthus sonchifolius]|uniref:Uncharacterized protein n=1 Tax=Smallanthus sonchifolius TaxID=185202 RepID=A0ACB8Z9H3_9ASTR|nr:hypothetical protein L1987_77189 [Smallanthus sonchifolius]
MSGVWMFDNGVLRLVGNPGSDSFQGLARRKVLVHVPSDEVVTSYDVLERMLSTFGWERYYDDPDLFHTYIVVNTLTLSLSRVRRMEHSIGGGHIDWTMVDSLACGRAMEGLARRKVLVHVPSDEVVTSYDILERMLSSFGWERYYDDPDLFQFHKRSTVHLISLPKHFNKLKSMHMYDIVVKNRNMFEVRDMCLN